MDPSGRSADGSDGTPQQETPPDDSSLSTSYTACSSSSNEGSGSHKRNPPAKPPRRRHSVTSLKDADCSASLRKAIQCTSAMRQGIRQGDADLRIGDPCQWILDPPPNFGGSPNCFSLSCQGGGRGIRGDAASPAGEAHNEFRSLPLSVSQDRKSFCNPAGGGGRLQRAPIQRPSHSVSSSATPCLAFLGRPNTGRDVPDVVSRSTLVVTSMPSPVGAASCSRRGCEARNKTAAAGHDRLLAVTPPGSPRRTHSDPVIHLDEVNEGMDQGIWTPYPRTGTATTTGRKTSGDMAAPSRYRASAAPEQIKALQEINNKLWNQIQHLQSQLDLLRRVKNNDKAPATVAGVSFAELLADLYYAQRERDSAMDERLANANQSLDIYQKELHKLAQARGDASDGLSSDDEESDNLVLSGLDKILQGLEGGWAPAKVTRHQETLLATVHRIRDNRGRKARHQLRVMQAERDLALEKVKVLEKDMQELHMKAIWKSENWTGSSADVVQQITNDKNTALGRMLDLQGSHGNVSCGSDRLVDGAKISTEAQTDLIGVEETPELVMGGPILLRLQEEVRHLGRRLDEEAAQRQNAEVKCQRLEELVNGLQKRLNGINNSF